MTDYEHNILTCPSYIPFVEICEANRWYDRENLPPEGSSESQTLDDFGHDNDLLREVLEVKFIEWKNSLVFETKFIHIDGNKVASVPELLEKLRETSYGFHIMTKNGKLSNYGCTGTLETFLKCEQGLNALESLRTDFLDALNQTFEQQNLSLCHKSLLFFNWKRQVRLRFSRDILPAAFEQYMNKSIPEPYKSRFHALGAVLSSEFLKLVGMSITGKTRVENLVEEVVLSIDM